MSKHSRDSDKADLQVVRNYIFAAFIGGWFLMIVIGALGHQLHLPRLFIGYWTAVLIEILTEYIFSQGSTVGPYLRTLIDNQNKLLNMLKGEK